MALPSLELRCLGAPGALVAGGAAPPEVLWRKHLALLVYLALAPGRRATRAQLHGLLWPEVDAERARRSLNEAVRRLRLVLGRDRLRTEGETLELDGRDLRIDVDDPLPHAAPARLPVFLDGFSVDDARPFDEWADAERARRGAGLVQHALAQGDAAVAAGRLAEALAWAAAVAEREPLSERAVALSMRALALGGDASGALAAFRAHEASLAALGERPSPATEALAARLRARTAPAGARASGATRPLVGRDVLHRRLFALADEARSGASRVVAVAGAAGMGKTRLALALRERAALEGAVTLAVTAMATGDEAPWAVVRALLRAGLGALPGSRAASPDALAVLAAVAPGTLAVPPRAPVDEGEVAAALASLLRAVAEEQPLVLALDDAASADGATLRALHAALRGLGDVPLLVLLTLVPPAADTPPALLALLGDLGRGLAGALLTLGPFDETEIAALVAASAPWCATAADRARLVRRLAFETGGDPLLCATLLDSLQELTAAREELLEWPPPQLTLESPLPVPVPVVVHSLLLARLAGLEAGDRRVLGAAALAGESIDESLVAAMLDVDVEVVTPALARLEGARFVEGTDDGFRFGAPLLARLLRHACLASAERRQCARRGAAHLAAATDPARQLLRCELELELGSAHAGEAARTVLALSRSAGVVLPRAARRVVERAAEALRAAPGDEPARQPLLMELDELRERLRAAAAGERGR